MVKYIGLIALAVASFNMQADITRQVLENYLKACRKKGELTDICETQVRLSKNVWGSATTQDNLTHIETTILGNRKDFEPSSSQENDLQSQILLATKNQPDTFITVLDENTKCYSPSYYRPGDLLQTAVNCRTTVPNEKFNRIRQSLDNNTLSEGLVKYYFDKCRQQSLWHQITGATTPCGSITRENNIAFDGAKENEDGFTLKTTVYGHKTELENPKKFIVPADRGSWVYRILKAVKSGSLGSNMTCDEPQFYSSPDRWYMNCTIKLSPVTTETIRKAFAARKAAKK